MTIATKEAAVTRAPVVTPVRTSERRAPVDGDEYLPRFSGRWSTLRRWREAPLRSRQYPGVFQPGSVSAEPVTLFPDPPSRHAPGPLRFQGDWPPRKPTGRRDS